MPVVSPAEYFPSKNAVFWRTSANGGFVQELHFRANSRFGWSYYAWVGWRDAGDEIRDHGWYRIPGLDDSVYASTDEAKIAADFDAVQRGFTGASPWKSAV